MFAGMTRLMPLALILSLAAVPAPAETQDDVLSARMLPGWKAADGHYMAAISLTLAPGWKTYWRAPGEAGIPPEFDWAGSQNLGGLRILWPSPQVIAQNGMESIGYRDGLTLPVEVTPADPGQPVHLALKMNLGVCHDICMPAEVTLKADLAGPGAPDQTIAAALQAGPKPAAAAGLVAVSCQLAEIKDGLRLTAKLDLPSQGQGEKVVVETGEPDVWVSDSTTDRQGADLTASADLVPPAGKPFVLDRSGVVLTVLAGGKSVEIHGCPAP
jgi:DsbC/DsbD-like thiol-disulfide interchange protein